jgi:two-component system phosphate regulon sensor histidine kinase PhoR
VIINLIDNSIKHTGNGEIQVGIKYQGEEILITVKDAGIGIPKEHLSRIFKRFYTVDKSRSRRLGGTGLGLYIVKHIIQLHGGSINVKSNTGEGTTFTAHLPIPVRSMILIET